MATDDLQPDLILMNGRIATQDEHRSFAQAVAVQNGRFLSVGPSEEIMRRRGSSTQVIDLGGRTVIPGLNDSHMHPIRGGLNYNMELRWDGVPSLADALRMLKEQAARTPAPQWVRVIGGWLGSNHRICDAGQRIGLVGTDANEDIFMGFNTYIDRQTENYHH